MKNQINSVQKQAERLSEITKTFIISGNIIRAKKCLAVAEKILVNGSTETKNIIVNTYIFSISTFLEMRRCSISNLFPKTLQTEYIKQINAIGI